MYITHSPLLWMSFWASTDDFPLHATLKNQTSIVNSPSSISSIEISGLLNKQHRFMNLHEIWEKTMRWKAIKKRFLEEKNTKIIGSTLELKLPDKWPGEIHLSEEKKRPEKNEAGKERGKEPLTKDPSLMTPKHTRSKVGMPSIRSSS